MAFNPRMYGNLANLSLGAPPLSEAELIEKRATSLPLTADWYPNVNNIDADTITVPEQEGRMRLDKIDAWESIVDEDNPDFRVQRQIENYAALKGVNPEDLDAKDIKRLGFIAKGKSQKLFNEGAYIRESGKIDKYGRPIVQAFTPGGVDISEALNTPEDNADYNSFYNRAGRAKDARLEKNWLNQQKQRLGVATGFDAEGKPEPQFDTETGGIKYGGRTFANEGAFNNFREVVDTQLADINAWGSSMPEQAAARLVAGGQSLWSQIVEQNVLAVEHGVAVTFDEQVSEYNRLNRTFRDTEAPVILDSDLTRYKSIQSRLPDPLSDEDQKFLSSDKGRILARLETTFADAKEARKEQADKEARRSSKVARAAEVGRSRAFTTLAEKEGIGSALWYAFRPDNIVASGGQMVESLPLMGVLAATPWVSVPAMGAMITSSVQQNKEEFAEVNNRAPTAGEMNIIRLGSIGQVLFEKVGADYILKGFPGGKAAFKQLFKGMPWMLTKPLGAGRATLETVLVEGTSGGMTELSQQYAVKQDFSKIDKVAIAEAAAQEAAGGLSMRGAVAGARGTFATAKAAKAALDRNQAAKDAADKDIADAPKAAPVTTKQSARAQQDFTKGFAETASKDVNSPDWVKGATAVVSNFNIVKEASAQLKEKVDALKKAKEAGETIDEKELSKLDLEYQETELFLSSAKKQVAKFAEQESQLQESLQEAASLETLFSVDVTDDAAVAAVDRSQMTEEVKELHDKKIEVAKSRTKLQKTESDKNIRGVHQEVTRGGNGNVGADQYLEMAQTGKMVEGSTEYEQANKFFSWIQKKHKAFVAAAEIYNKTNKPAYVRKSDGAVVTSRDPDMETGDYWEIGSNAKKLVDVLAKEADYVTKTSAYIDAAIELNKRTSFLKDKQNVEDVNRFSAAVQALQTESGNIEDITPKKKTEAKAETETEAAEETVEESPPDYLDETPPPEAENIPDETVQTEAETETETEVEVETDAEVDVLTEIVTSAVAAGRKILDFAQKNKIAKAFLGKTGKALTSLADIFSVIGSRKDSLFSRIGANEITAENIRSTVEEILNTDEQYAKSNSRRKRATKGQLKEISDRFLALKKAIQNNPDLLPRMKDVMDKAGEVYTKGTAELFYTYDENGAAQLPDRMLLAFTIASINWTRVNGLRSVEMTREQVAQLIYGDRDAQVTDSQYDAVKNVGIPLTSAANDIGAEIVSILGLRVKGIDDVDYRKNINQQSFESSLGALAIDLLANTKDQNGNILFERSQPTVNLSPEGAARDELNINPLFTEGTSKAFNVVKAMPSAEDTALPAKHIEALHKKFAKTKAAVSPDKLIKAITGKQSQQEDIYDEPIEETQSRIRNSLFGFPNKQTRLLKAQQSRGWRSITGMFKAQSMMSKEVMEGLAGVQDLTNTPKGRKDSKKAANEKRLNDLRHLQDYIDAGRHENGRPIYFRYKVMNQLRTFIASSGLNPQESKVARFFLTVAKEPAKIDSMASRQLFAVAVAQGFGFDIDKNSIKYSIDSFNQIIEHPDVKAAVAAYNAGNAAEFNRLLPLINSNKDLGGGGNFGMVNAIVALADYSPDSAFETDIVIEADATTSGYAIGLLQFFGKDPVERRIQQRRVGIMQKGDGLFDEILDENEYDTYQAIGEIVGDEIIAGIGDPTTKNRKGLRALGTFHGEFFEEKDGKRVLTKFARKVAKSPFMIFNYGAGMAKILGNIAKEAVEGFYDKIEDLQVEYNNAKAKNDTQAMKDIIAEADALGQSAMALSGSIKNLKLGNIIKSNGAKKFALTDQQTASLTKNIATLYNKPFTKAMDDLLGGTKERRDLVTTGMNASFHVYNYFLDKELMKVMGISKITNDTFITQAEYDQARQNLKDRGIIYGLKTRWHSEADGTEGYFDLNKWESVADTEGAKVETKIGSAGSKLAEPQYTEGKEDSLKESPRSKRVTTRARLKKMMQPDAAGVVRTIQMIDASIIGDVAIQDGFLSLYDAMMGSPDTVGKLLKEANKSYVKSATDYSIVENTAELLSNLMDNIPAEDRAAAERIILDSYQAAASNAEQAAEVTLDGLQGDLNTLNENIKKEREEVLESIDFDRVKNIYLPELTEDPDILRFLRGAEESSVAEPNKKRLKQRRTIKDYILGSLGEQPSWVKDADWQRLDDWKQIVVDYMTAEEQSFPDTSYLRELAMLALLKSQALDENGEILNTNTIKKNLVQMNQPHLDSTGTLAGLAGEIISDFSEVNTPAKQKKEGEVLKSIDAEKDAKIKREMETGNLAQDTINIGRKLDEMSDPVDGTDQREIEHRSTLKFLMNRLIAPTLGLLQNVQFELNSTDIYSHGSAAFDSSGNPRKITVNYRDHSPTSYAEQSEFEVYVHEIIHAITNKALLTAPAYRDRVNQLYKATKAKVTYEHFLRRDADGNIIYLTDKAEEIKRAKQQYKRVFGSEDAQDTHLKEFIAYGLSNKHLAGELRKIRVAKPKLWQGKWYENVFSNILAVAVEAMDMIKRAVRGQSVLTSKDAYNELLELTMEVTQANNAREGMLRNQMTNLAQRSLIKRMDENTAKYLKKGITKAANMAAMTKDKQGNLRRRQPKNVFDVLIIAAGFPLTKSAEIVRNNPEFMKAMHTIFTNSVEKLPAIRGIWDIVTRVFGRRPPEWLYKGLNLTKQIIEAGRHKTKEDMKSVLISSVLNQKELTTDVRNNITRVLMKTDAEVLFSSENYSPQEFYRMLFAPTARSNKIKQLRQQMGFKSGSFLDRQAEGLSDRMTKNKPQTAMIYSSVPAILSQLNKENRVNEQLLEEYITLLALDKTSPDAINSIKKFYDLEFAANPENNGIVVFMEQLGRFKRESIESNFGGRSMRASKGFISRRTGDFIETKLGTRAEEKSLKQAGFVPYKTISPKDLAGSGLTGEYILYVNQNSTATPRTPGLISMSRQTHNGTSAKLLIGMEETDPKKQTKAFNRLLLEQQRQGRKGTTQTGSVLTPVVNSIGEVTDLMIRPNDMEFEQDLKQDMDAFSVLPDMFMQTYDLAASEKLNREHINRLQDDYKENKEVNPYRYINIFDDKYKKEYFDVLPWKLQLYIKKIADKKGRGNNREYSFFVDDKFKEQIFGYTNPSIFNTTLFAGSPQVAAYMKKTGAVWSDFVNIARSAVVLKIPDVQIGNLMSNLITSRIRGVPISEVMRSWKEANQELEKYLKYDAELRRLDILIGGSARNDTVANRKRRESLVTRMNNSVVAPLMDMGFYATIAEDVELDADKYRSKFMTEAKKKLAEKTAPVPGLHATARWMYLTERTEFHEQSTKILRTSDFIARYALMKHMKTEGETDAKIFQVINDTFVNYNVPLPRYLSWMDSVGMTRFIRYWTDIQRPAWELIKERPASVGIYFMIQSLTGLRLDSILNSSLLLGSTPQSVRFLDVIREAVIPPGVELGADAVGKVL